MLPSPYTPGALPGYLAGRGAELDTIRGRLSRMRVLARSGGPLLAFHGARGLGKTSLLRTAQREALEEGYLTVWVTGRDDEPQAPDLARRLRDSVERSSFGSRAAGLLQSLERVQLEVGVPGAKVAAEGRTGARRPTSIEQSLEEAGRLAHRNDHHGLAVFVDELQEARLSDRRSLLIALQHFDGAPEGCPVTVVGAGLPSLLGAIPEAATFGERTEFHEVGLLNEVAVAEALLLPAEAVGVGWSQAAVEEAIGLAAGYPHQVQLIGDGAWAAAHPQRGEEITAGHVRQGHEAVVRRMETLFATRLAKSTPGQQRVLRAMATAGSEPVARTEIARRLGVEPDALSRVRQELIERGLVEPAGRGLLRFTIPGFGAYLREQVAEEGGGTSG